MYQLVRPLLFALPGEVSHDLTLAALRGGLGALYTARVESRPVSVMGLNFPNPVGLAAGLDKNGDCVDGLARLGFGFIEVGTVTPRAQPGNPRPRLFRIPGSNALINRMGFNNHGLDYLCRSLDQRRFDGVLGINIGKNKDTPADKAVDDYLTCLDRVHSHASYVVVNVSSPNTPGLRDLQHGEALDELLSTLRERQNRLDQQSGRRVPLVIKISPDNTEEELGAMATAILSHELDGVTVSNTTLDRSGITGRHAGETGGLSGAPLKKRADQALTIIARELGGRVPIIGVGGILSAEDALEKRRLGASLVQLYTGLIYRGPGLVGQVTRAWPRV